MPWKKRKTWPVEKEHDPVQQAILRKNVQMATIGYTAVRKKREQLLALQAKLKIETQEVNVEADKEGQENDLKYPSKDLLQDHWEKLAAAILSDNTRNMTPVEDTKEDDNSEIGSDEGGEGGMMPSRFYHLVTQLSNSREVIARFKAMAPIKQNKGEKRSLKYGQFRRDMAEQHDSYNSIKGCRYLRVRSDGTVQKTDNPFAINEIFGEKK